MATTGGSRYQECLGFAHYDLSSLQTGNQEHNIIFDLRNVCDRKHEDCAMSLLNLKGDASMLFKVSDILEMQVVRKGKKRLQASKISLRIEPLDSM